MRYEYPPVELVTALAAALGPTWAVEQRDMETCGTTGSAVLMNRSEGAEALLWVTIERTHLKQPDRLVVRVGYPSVRTPIYLLGINALRSDERSALGPLKAGFSLDRPIEAISRRVLRQLVPVATQAYRMATVRLEAAVRSHNAIRESVKKIAGMLENRYDHGQEAVTGYVGLSRVDAHVHMESTTVDLRITAVPIEVAQAMVELLRSNLNGSVAA